MILIFVFLVAVLSEVTSRSSDDPMFENPMMVRIVHGGMLIIIGFLCLVVRKGTWVQLFFCPILTIYIHVLFNEWIGVEE